MTFLFLFFGLGWSSFLKKRAWLLPKYVTIHQETRTWKQTYGKALANRASADMDEIFQFIDNLNKRLSRPIVDLEDVRGSMAALTEMRDAEIRIEMTITPIEDSFALLNR